MDTRISKQQLTKNLFSLTFVQIVTYIFPLISVPIISRIIGPDKYGIINFGVAYVAYFTLLISYSFDYTATRKIAKDPDNKANRNLVFSEVFYTQCLLFTFSTTIFILLLYIIPALEVKKNILIFSFFLCIATLFTQNWLFQAMQDLSKVALFNLISKVLFTVLIILLIRKNSDYIWQPILIGTIQISISIFSFCWAFNKYEIKFIKIPITRCFKLLWEDKLVFFSLVFVNFYTTTNTVFLGLYQNEEQIGYFTAGQRLIVIAQSVLAMPLAQSLYPYIGKAFGESKEKGIKVAQKIIPLIILFIGLASVIMYLLGPIVIRLFYGEKFEPAIHVFQILSILPLIFSLNNVLGIQIMLNIGMDKYFFRVTAFAGILSISLNILMIKNLGYIGTSINWLTTEILIFITMYIILRRKKVNPINIKYFKLEFILNTIRPIAKKSFTQMSKKKILQ